MNDQLRDALLKEYSETLSNFRLLTEIRFKLLTLLPAAPILTFALSRHTGGADAFVIAAFGLAITIGLVTYNVRNDQLYDELVRRAASIERSLDLADGTFANRPRHWLTIRLLGRKRCEWCKRPIDHGASIEQSLDLADGAFANRPRHWLTERCKWPIDHRVSIGLIYGASVALWLFLLLMPVLELTVRDLLPERWVKVLALTLATVVTALAAEFVIDKNRERREEMRGLAKSAVHLVITELANCAVELVKSTELAKILGAPEKIKQLVDLCTDLSEMKPSVVEARACFYTKEPEKLARYLPPNSKEQLASQFVALLTDLTPEYLLDCYTNRTGLAEEFSEGSAAKEPVIQ